MITLDLDFYWIVVGSVATVLASAWAYRRIRSLLGGR